MITYKELLGSHTIAEVPIAHQHNLEELLICVNKLRSSYGMPMVVTSGYRSLQEHFRIYSQKGIMDRTKIPMQSNHLSGNAVDFADPFGQLYKWAFENQDRLEAFGIWCEANTKGWLHCQRVPPKSGARFFLP